MRRSNFALRLQPSLFAEVRKAAKSEGVALNQFINVAVAEKLATLRTEEFFLQRARGADREEALRILKRAGKGNPPIPGDELPPGWAGWNSRPSKKAKSSPKRRTVKALRTA
jgi:hypothetical protein